MKNTIQTLLRTIRLPFLILTPACVGLGACAAYYQTQSIDTFDLTLVLLAALSAHISVNTFNEYFDFRSGLDSLTNKTPFSGGSGGLIDNPSAAKQVLTLAVISLVVTVLIGLYFVIEFASLLLILGAIGILIILTYTSWLNRSAYLCLIAPGLGFGPLMVVGTYIVLTGESALFAVFISFIPFFLTNNLLLLNQFPDIEADKKVGRRHFPIKYGTEKSLRVYAIFLLISFLLIFFSIVFDQLPTKSLITFLPLSTGVLAYFGTKKYANNLEKLTPYLSLNVVTAVLTPITLGISLI